MQCRLKGFARFEDAEGDLCELTHHGADDQLGRLAVGGQAFKKALPPVGPIEGDQGGHVERAA